MFLLLLLSHVLMIVIIAVFSLKYAGYWINKYPKSQYKTASSIYCLIANRLIPYILFMAAPSFMLYEQDLEVITILSGLIAFMFAVFLGLDLIYDRHHIAPALKVLGVKTVNTKNILLCAGSILLALSIFFI